jgi:LPXTG-motif cell wall-anchored protein
MAGSSRANPRGEDMISHTLGRLAAGAPAVLLALCSFALATPADAAPGTDCPAYANPITAEISVSISPSDLSPGDSFTASATVTSSSADVPVAGGSVVFRYAGQSASVPVGASGTASTTFTAEKGTLDVTASYSGRCLAGSGAVRASAHTVPVVAGVDTSAGGGGGTANRPPAEVAGVGGLASTGFDSRTELLGLLGLGLVGAGAVTMVVRRRSHG